MNTSVTHRTITSKDSLGAFTRHTLRVNGYNIGWVRNGMWVNPENSKARTYKAEIEAYIKANGL